jgi:hypothetical protein
MRHILIGYGEVGKAVYEVLKDTYEIEIHDQKMNFFVDEFTTDTTDVLMIAIPYTDLFEERVSQYQRIFHAKHTLIFSSVPVGTSTKLGATHSPIEGDHSDMASYINKHKRWVGGTDARIIEFLYDAGFDLVMVARPETTEFLKLRSTTYYGLCIEFARYSKAVCDEIGMEYDIVKEYDQDYNALNNDMGLADLNRYVLDPPEGPIGGHCVLPNIKLLQKQKPECGLLNYIEKVNNLLALTDSFKKQ